MEGTKFYLIGKYTSLTEIVLLFPSVFVLLCIILQGVAGVPGTAMEKINTNKNPLFLIEEEKKESAAKLSNMEREMEEVNIINRTIGIIKCSFTIPSPSNLVTLVASLPGLRARENSKGLVPRNVF